MPQTRRWLAVTWLPEFNVAVFALLLNYPWEFSQVPLFAGMAGAPHWEAIQRCAMATLGDIVIMLIAYWSVAVVARSRYWIAAPTAAHLTMFVAVGVTITVLIEQLALNGLWFGGWDYSPLMPVIPGIGVGLSPLAQWVVLPLLTAWFVRRQLTAASHLYVDETSSQIHGADQPDSHQPRARAMSTVVLDSVLTCPLCGHTKRESMPTDACRFFYECEGCKALLRPRAGDCCVFCSFGSVKCPPVQAQQSCGR